MENSEQQTGMADAAVERGGYRSGVAARLAGLSAATLRVWERRYRLTATERSASGQRLYTAGQVRRLGLLKQLVDQGHAIGTLAALPSARLVAMWEAGGVPAKAGPAGAAANDDEAGVAPAPVAVAAIGAGLVRRLGAAIAQGLPLALVAQASKLALSAELLPARLSGVAPSAAAAAQRAQVLLIELAEPDTAAIEQLLAAREHSGAAAAVVLYRFCSSATVRALRAKGFLVARFPAELGELPLLCRAALQRRPGAQVRQRASASAPRFDDVTLAGIGAGEAPMGGNDDARMLADLLLQMGSFERYSARCAEGGQGSVDALLHRHLELVAADARVLLEGAMDRLLRQGG